MRKVTLPILLCAGWLMNAPAQSYTLISPTVYQGQTALTISGTNVTIDFKVASEYKITLTTNVYFFCTNMQPGQNITIDILQNATGTWAIDYDKTEIKAGSAQYLTMTTNANAWSLISMKADSTATKVAIVQTLNFQ